MICEQDQFDISCCDKCHLDYEEEFLLPYLPQPIAEEIKRQHRVLTTKGYNAKDIQVHSNFEETFYRQYLPGPLWRHIMEEHEHMRERNAPDEHMIQLGQKFGFGIPPNAVIGYMGAAGMGDPR
jgi:hypothetical protein